MNVKLQSFNSFVGILLSVLLTFLFFCLMFSFSLNGNHGPLAELVLGTTVVWDALVIQSYSFLFFISFPRLFVCFCSKFLFFGLRYE